MKTLARGVLVSAVVSLTAACGVSKLLELEAPGGTPALMTSVLISKEGGGYKIQYSLQDKDLAYTSADGAVTVWFVDFESESRVFFTKTYEVEKSDFKKYETLLGREVWGHLIILGGSEVSQYGSDIFDDEAEIPDRQGGGLRGRGHLFHVDRRDLSHLRDRFICRKATNPISRRSDMPTKKESSGPPGERLRDECGVPEGEV